MAQAVPGQIRAAVTEAAHHRYVTTAGVARRSSSSSAAAPTPPTGPRESSVPTGARPAAADR
ncbi:hypothetical protein BJP40_04380 [Streptomyces sp. CC53]|nr:hypothetical protein BJP40_04380 [Streptomyces sp. CC53]